MFTFVKNKIKSIIKAKKDHALRREYTTQLATLQGIEDIEVQSKIAVVIHLFYPDNWPLFQRKIQLLPAGSYDLFVTVPTAELRKLILDHTPAALVTIIPNRGRDVLPFIKVAHILYEKGYTVVLKFHSKKSTHRSDGQDWLESMLDQILPDTPKTIAKIMKLVHEPDFGVLGPSSVYYPLTINFPANGVWMTRVVSRLFGKNMAHSALQVHRKEYGFFGGTMFWINLESIKDLLKYDERYFELESGQIDGTFAHALERLFCVIPELKGKKIYESTGRVVRLRSYASDTIPDWSEDHDK